MTLIVHASASFAYLVQTEERIKDGLTNEKIEDYQTHFEQSSSGMGSSTKKISPTEGMKGLRNKFI